MPSTNTHLHIRRRCTLLAAAIAASLSLMACGSSSSSNPSAASATSSRTPSAPAATAATSSSSQDAPSVAGVSLNQMNDKLKHLTPQQVAQIKARLPLYIKTQEACIKQVGQEATNVLACLHQHGF